MFGFLIAIAAGAATPSIEVPAARPVARMLGRHMEIHDNELRLLAFIIAMIAAAIVASVFDTGSALGIMLGGTIGYFGLRLFAWLRRIIEGRKP